jgi:hypothetical protein
MSKVVPFKRSNVSSKMKVKKGGFLEELRSLLAPVGVNPTVAALGLTAASRSLSKTKRSSSNKKVKRKSPKKRKQKGGDLLSELIAPQGLSSTGTAALLLGAAALSGKPSSVKKSGKRKSPKKSGKSKSSSVKKSGKRK